MNLIVDANIVFSGILNTDGKIGDLLINSVGYLKFIAPEYLRKEIKNHYPKLSKISKLSLSQIHEAEFQIYKDITFISEDQISSSAWIAAEKLVVDVDPNDIAYVAFSIHFNAEIWSGDKQLIAGLARKGFNNILDTVAVFSLRSKLKEP